MTSNSNVSSSLISLPKGGGAIGGMGETFTPDPFRGTGNFSVPFKLSAGRDGFSPQLNLEYSTGNGNGPFGMGWRLTIPEVTRSTRKGLPRYTDGDTFLFAGSDDLVPDATVAPKIIGDYSVTRFRPRTEGLFARIEYWQYRQQHRVPQGLSCSFWKVTTGDNITSIFGATTKGILADSEYEDHIFRWCLELSYDGKGNYIRYIYKPEDESGIDNEPERLMPSANLFLKEIKYGNLTALASGDTAALVLNLTEDKTKPDCIFHVVLDYGEHGRLEDGEELITDSIHVAEREWDSRGDPFSTYLPGFEVRTRRLCKRLLMLHEFPDTQTLLVRSYDFAYQSFEHNKITALARLTERGYRKSETKTLKRSEEAALGDRGVRSHTYEIASLPPLEFEYSKFEPIKSDSLVSHLISFEGTGNNKPVGLEDTHSALIDLFSRGLTDILETQPDGYVYWQNLGHGHFSDMQRLDAAPQHITLGQPGVGLSDISGDGYPDLLELRDPRWGYYRGRLEGGWGAFQPFESQPDFTLADTNLNLIDLTGDGSLDALRTDANELVFYECIGEKGFSGPKRIPRIRDLRKFPDITFTDPRIHVADMTGDGLADIVMIEPEKLHYWPNLGFGRFGARITTQIPGLLHFEPEQMHFVDIDGSGPADLIQVEDGRVSFWMNQSGNGWSARYEIRGTPSVVSPGSVKITDMLGTGTAGILWGSPAGFAAYRYLPLTAGTKPGLLTRMSNNMGLTKRFYYRPSIEFEATDKNGRDVYVDHLPFTVYVLSRVETLDHIAGSTLITEYGYTHGHYDHIEREFVGFGRVEQWDTEALPWTKGVTTVTNALDQAPVETKTWFHTGVGDNTSVVPGRFTQEYYAGDPAAPDLPDSTLPVGISLDERRQALRALKGRPLRQEIYGRDGSPQSEHPYTVTEHVYDVRRIQADAGRAPVFSARQVQLIEYHYERNPADPRMTQQLALEADEFNHVTLAAQVVYPRRPGDHVEPEQAKSLKTATQTRYGQRTNVDNGYRHGVPVEEQTFEITGIMSAAGDLLAADQLRNAIKKAAEINYEDQPVGNIIQKRTIAWTRFTYWDDAAKTALPAGQVGLLALPHHTAEAAFTPGLLQRVFGDQLEQDILTTEGGYVFEDGIWWKPSGHPQLGGQVFDPSQFYRPVRSVDAFGNVTKITYDRYALLLEETKDPVGNLIRVENDYRVLTPKQIIDPNGNRQAVACDALGMVIGSAVMGKEEENVGDSLNGFQPDLDRDVVLQHIAEPLRDPESILGKATTRVLYDAWRYYRTRRRTQTAERGEPIIIYAMGRETHESNLKPGTQTRTRHSFLYQDGFGRTIETKIQAEPGLAPLRNNREKIEKDRTATTLPGKLDIDPTTGQPVQEVTTSRWVGAGRTLYNNKGKPVKQYEPFFSVTHLFEEEPEMAMTGVTPILFYDPLERVVATLHPNHTYEKVVFDPWQQSTWDVNDTLKLQPQTDPDIGSFFRRLPEAEYLPTWYERRKDGQLGIAEQQAAQKTTIHADTPMNTHFDTLGRTFMTIAHNRFIANKGPVEERYATRIELDIEGNQRAVIDAKDRVVMRYDYDILSNRIYQASMEAGEHRMLNDVMGKPIRAWDSRRFMRRINYDQLHRPTELFVKESGNERLAEQTVYGESQGDENNHKTRVYQVFDGAGVVTSVAYDFKGNLLHSTRQLTHDYKNQLDWSRTVPLETQTFESRTGYDALNRPISQTSPDNSVIRPSYNEANLLERIEANLRGADAVTTFVRDIDYNAKGQRERIEYGNDVVTLYDYDPETFRLINLKTKRSAGLNSLASELFADSATIQNLSYTYDPAGNITEISDNAISVIYHNNEQVEPVSRYAYDAIYRLIAADGREHIGQTASDFNPPDGNYRDYPFVGMRAETNDPQAVRNYDETYEYDPVGNIVFVRHTATNGSWTHSYDYQSPSMLEQGKTNNRLTRTSVGDMIESYSYSDAQSRDMNGCMTSIHRMLMDWDFKEQLRRADLGGGGVAYYVYDAAGQRVRKVIERQNATRKEDCIYLGRYEIFRQYKGNGTDVELECETLHMMDDKQRIALVETKTVDVDTTAPNMLPRTLTIYQQSNHLGSAILELDSIGMVISCEEYYPYGSTSYQIVRSDVEVNPKRYRYTGKERDEETGLYYHGARYYAPWLGRWTTTDPSGITESTNLYEYTRNRPINFTDPSGFQGQESQALIKVIDQALGTVGGKPPPPPPPPLLPLPPSPIAPLADPRITPPPLKSPTATIEPLDPEKVERSNLYVQNLYNLVRWGSQQSRVPLVGVLAIPPSVDFRLNDTPTIRDIVKGYSGQLAIAEWFGTLSQGVAGMSFGRARSNYAEGSNASRAAKGPLPLDIPKLKNLVVEQWQKGLGNQPVKVVPSGSGQKIMDGGVIKGFITQQKFLVGKTPTEMEKILGLIEGSLGKGAEVIRLGEVPKPAQFEFITPEGRPPGTPGGYTNVPGSRGYPPGLGAPQWYLKGAKPGGVDPVRPNQPYTP